MSFDRVARSYFLLEKVAFGSALQRARVALLDQVTNAKRIQIVGDGDGRFLVELLRRAPHATIDCVDASARMLELAKRRVQENSRVRFFHHDILSWDATADHYDLIVTHFVLDCFREEKLADIVLKLGRSAKLDASWLLADFCVPKRGFAKWRAQVWLAMMYRFFRLTTGIEATQLVDPTSLLESQNFSLIEQRFFSTGMLKSELWRRSANEKSTPNSPP